MSQILLMGRVCLGGIDPYFLVRDRRYYLKDAVRLAKAARRTPVVCG